MDTACGPNRSFVATAAQLFSAAMGYARLDGILAAATGEAENWRRTGGELVGNGGKTAVKIVSKCVNTVSV